MACESGRAGERNEEGGEEDVDHCNDGVLISNACVCRLLAIFLMKITRVYVMV